MGTQEEHKLKTEIFFSFKLKLPLMYQHIADRAAVSPVWQFWCVFRYRSRSWALSPETFTESAHSGCMAAWG